MSCRSVFLFLAFFLFAFAVRAESPSRVRQVSGFRSNGFDASVDENGNGAVALVHVAPESPRWGGPDSGGDNNSFLMGDPDDYRRVAKTMLRELSLPAIGIALVALAVPEIKSFGRDYLRGAAHAEPLELRVFIYPLGRLLLLLAIVVPGAFALYYRKTSCWYAVLLVLARTASDLLVHAFGSRKGPKNS